MDRKHRLQFFQERANPLLPEALPEMFTRLVNGENLAIERAPVEHLKFVQAKSLAVERWEGESITELHGDAQSVERRLLMIL